MDRIHDLNQNSKSLLSFEVVLVSSEATTDQVSLHQDSTSSTKVAPRSSSLSLWPNQ